MDIMFLCFFYGQAEGKLLNLEMSKVQSCLLVPLYKTNMKGIGLNSFLLKAIGIANSYELKGLVKIFNSNRIIHTNNNK